MLVDPAKEQAALQNLGEALDTEFCTTERRRNSGPEKEWAKDLRLYNGEYEADVLDRIGKKKSKAFMRLPKIKVDTILARMMDLLFPSTGEKNWGIRPTPKPDLAWALLYSTMMDLIPEGTDIESMDQEALAGKAAKVAADNMTLAIADQLQEVDERSGYQAVIRKVLSSGLKLGTGVLKGPSVESRLREKWVWVLGEEDKEGDDGQWELDLVEDQGKRPGLQFVPLQNFFPDMDATHITEARFVWQTYLMLKHEVEDLRKKKSFNARVIEKYLEENPEGDALLTEHETEVRTKSENAPEPITDRYRLKERWGYVSGRVLANCGLDLMEKMTPSQKEDAYNRAMRQNPELSDSEIVQAVRDQAGNLEFVANIWLLGDRVVKAVVRPVKGVKIPYYLWHFQKDENSIFGEGVPRVARDPVLSLNAAFRKMLDQSALSGPMFGVNNQALAEDEDPRNIHGNKVFLFENPEDIEKAMKMWLVPAYTEQYLSIIKLCSQFVDEVTTPSFVHGEGGKVKGAGETASGLSMLFGALNINLKELIKTYDTEITIPCITGLYHWNMQFNPDSAVKGDCEVEARGSSALIAREVHAEKLLKVLELRKGDPEIKGLVKGG
ncbi:MAG: hypothetical protein SVS15_10660, partial [Thermodesulfobacteriota bacterium]|nr:hypothetical protein [Thermodesulfobacteriota bacterium]